MDQHHSSPSPLLCSVGRLCSSPGPCRTHFHWPQYQRIQPVTQLVYWLLRQRKGRREQRDMLGGKAKCQKLDTRGLPDSKALYAMHIEDNGGQFRFLLGFGLLIARGLKILLEAGQHLAHSLPVCLFVVFLLHFVPET